MKKLIILAVLLFTAAITFGQETKCTDVIFVNVQRYNPRTESFERVSSNYPQEMELCMSEDHVEINNEKGTYIFLTKALTEKYISSGRLFEFEGRSTKGENYVVYMTFSDTEIVMNKCIISLLLVKQQILIDYHLNPFTLR